MISPGTPAATWRDRVTHPIPVIPVVLYLIHVVLLWHFSIDDVGISYRYALHLAEGYGLTWNPGQMPVEGYSNFLWVLFLGGGRWLGLDIEVLSKIAGLCLGGATLILLNIICRRLWTPKTYRWFPVLLVAVCPVWIMWVVSGLELASVSFFLVLVFFSLTTTGVKRVYLSAIALCGLSLSRPEGITVAGLFLLLGLIGDRELPWRRRLALYGIPALALIVCTTGHVLFRLAYYGYPTANTVVAKFATSLPSLHKVGSWFLFGLPFFASYLLVLRKSSTPRDRFIFGVAFVLILWQMLLVLPVSPVMYILHRYQIAYLPLLVLPIPFVLNWVRQRQRGWALLISALLTLWTVQQWPGALAQYEMQRQFYRQHRRIAEQIVRLPHRPTIAMVDAGRIPYWTDFPAIDVWGLCDSRLAWEGFSPQAVWDAELGPPDVFVISVDAIGAETIPHMGLDRLLSEDPYFKGNYKPWQIFPSGDYYGYAIMFHVDWAVRQGFPVISIPAEDWQNK